MSVKKIKLPMLNKFPEQNRWLSMDEYIKFVNFNLKYFIKNKNVKRDELAMRVNVPFSIR